MNGWPAAKNRRASPQATWIGRTRVAGFVTVIPNWFLEKWYHPADKHREIGAEWLGNQRTSERRRCLALKLLRNGLVRTSIMQTRQTDGPKEGEAKVKPLA